MSFARIIASIACLGSLFGCALTQETRTIKNADGSTTASETKRLSWAPSPYGAVIAQPVFYYTGYPVYYRYGIGHYYQYGGRQMLVAPHIVARCVRRGNVIPRC